MDTSGTTGLSLAPAALLRLANGGDTEALGELYDHVGPLAYRVAYGLTGDAGRAEDAVAEAFRAARTAPGRQTGSVAGWIVRLTAEAAA